MATDAIGRTNSIQVCYLNTPFLLFGSLSKNIKYGIMKAPEEEFKVRPKVCLADVHLQAAKSRWLDNEHKPRGEDSLPQCKVRPQLWPEP